MKRKINYKWGAWSKTKADPDIVGDVLAKIKHKNGVLTAALVVEQAKPVDAPMHECFEWSNGKAANLYRCEQAKNIIRAIRIVQVDDAGREDERIAYVHVKHEERGHVFVSSVEAISDDDMRDQVISETLTMLGGLQNRLRMFDVLRDEADAIAKISESLSSKSSKRKSSKRKVHDYEYA